LPLAEKAVEIFKKVNPSMVQQAEQILADIKNKMNQQYPAFQLFPKNHRL
jgi:hypothetical protein